MFCRLYELKVGTGINLTDHEKCDKENCSFYTKDEKCGISQDCSVHLNKDRFGWLIDEKINLQKPLKETGGKIYYDKMIQLIHPTHADIWVFKCMKKDMETITYIVYLDGKQRGMFKDLDEVNNKLNDQKMSYDGRKIQDRDFNFLEN